MPLNFEILGNPGRDNALLVTVDSGQRVTRLLFDCGANCLDDLSSSRIKSIDALFFSHLHMDHVSGFDQYFRPRYDLPDTPNLVFGPAGTAAILQHRFQGYLWNLHATLNGVWQVNDIEPDNIAGHRFLLKEAFAYDHAIPVIPCSGIIYENTAIEVKVIHLQHHGPCCGYIVREKPQCNIDSGRLSDLGIPPGPWIRHIKERSGPDTLQIGNKTFSRDALHAELCRISKGQSIAYLTDFLLDEPTFALLRARIAGCDTAVMESQYRSADAELAQKNHHTTVQQVAQLAKAAEIGELILFHISDRYPQSEWPEILREAHPWFPNTRFPNDWVVHPQTTDEPYTGKPADIEADLGVESF